MSFESSYEFLSLMPRAAIGFLASSVLIFVSIFGIMAMMRQIYRKNNVVVSALLIAALSAMVFSVASLGVLLKVSLASSVYLYLKTLKLDLPPEQRDEWTVLGMAFYPDATGFFGRIFNLSWRK